ncbi:MAG: vitamin B12 dependent-methionine synthase activation domain-containing protein [Anaerolineales bacterium]|jgi:hypothetical protein
MNILTDLQLFLSVDDILRGQGVDPQIVRAGKRKLILAAEHALNEGLSLLHPVALAHEIVVQAHRHDRILLEGGSKLTGPLVTRHLAGAQRVVAAVSTIGPELEAAVTHLLNADPLYALALDGLGNAAVELLAQQVCARLGEQVLAEGYQASTPLSPGSPEWPVEVGQPQIFALLDPAQAGISLTSGGMMFPKKSVSFVVGLGPEMSQANLCEVCSLKETCRYQHA